MPDPSEQVRRFNIVGCVVVSLGIAAVVGGIFGPRLMPAEVYWTESDAAEYTEAYEAAHSASIGHDHASGSSPSHDSVADDELAAARERLANADRRLQQARNVREKWGKILSVSGAVLALIGVRMLRRSH